MVAAAAAAPPLGSSYVNRIAISVLPELSFETLSYRSKGDHKADREDEWKSKDSE